MRLGHCLENMRDRLRVGQPDFRRHAAAVHGGVALAIDRRGAVLGDEIHQARHPGVGFRRRAEERDKMLLLHGGVDAGAKFLLGKPALVQVFRQQRIIRFGDVLDQFAMQLDDLFLPRAGGRDLREFSPAGSEIVSDDLIAQHVQHLVETGAGIDRDVHGKNAGAEMFAGRSQGLVEIRIDLVQGIDDQNFRDAEVGRVIPDPFGADADAVLGMDDHQGKIGHTQSAERFADEIQVAGRVNDVELLAHPFGMEQGSLHGNAPLLFADVIIGDRAAIGDPAHAADDAAASQHGLAQHGFTAGSMAGDGEVADIGWRVFLHNISTNQLPPQSSRWPGDDRFKHQSIEMPSGLIHSFPCAI